MNLPPECELLRFDLPRGRFRAVLFDFDGTLSLFREGWPRVMAGLGVEALRAAGAREPADELHALVEEGVMRLNGKPTLVQMEWLAAEVARRGGTPADPAEYKAEYTARLLRLVDGRTGAVESGRARPQEWAVPGAHALLAGLQHRGVPVYLASGTDAAFVLREVGLLGLADHFGPHVHAPVGDGDGFSKRAVIERVLTSGVRGEELLGFGDGWVETEEVRRVGGVAVGVASDEEGRGVVNAAKRERLLAAGADVIVPDYRHADALLAWLFGD
jgi:phosphoglycolate phosphatase-like HAD superfamily hydrolase